QVFAATQNFSMQAHERAAHDFDPRSWLQAVLRTEWRTAGHQRIDLRQIAPQPALVADWKTVGNQVRFQGALPGLTVAAQKDVTWEERQMGGLQTPPASPFAFIQGQKEGNVLLQHPPSKGLFRARLGMQYPPVLGFIVRPSRVAQQVVGENERLQRQ